MFERDRGSLSSEIVASVQSSLPLHLKKYLFLVNPYNVEGDIWESSVIELLLAGLQDL